MLVNPKASSAEAESESFFFCFEALTEVVQLMITGGHSRGQA
jgi:hypothetical protein